MVNVEYDYDQDERYGVVHIEIGLYACPTIVIHSGGRNYGFEFHEGGMIPICICHARTKSECCCETGCWDEEF